MSRRSATLAALPPAVAVVFLLATPDGSFVAGAWAVTIRLFLWTGILLSCATLAGAAYGSRLSGWRHVIWDGATGLAGLMAVLLIVGLFPGGFRRPTLMIVTGTVFIAALAVRVLRRRAPDRGAASARAASPAMLFLFGLVLAAGLIWNRVPPVFFDTLAYHYAQPNLWLLEGRFAPETWSLYSWFPPGMSALYGLGLAWGGDTAANDANLLVGLLLLALAGDLSRHLWGAPASWLAPAVLIVLPITVHALGIPAADLAHGTFVFGALAAWVLWRGALETIWLRRAAVLAGGAVLTKALGLLVPVGLGALLFGFFDGSGRRPSISTGVRRATAFLVPPVLMMLPWLGANLVVLGNPMAPILAPVLPVDGLADGGHEAFHADAMGGLPSAADLAWLVPRVFTGDPESEGIYPTPAWSWMPLVLIAVLLLRSRDLPRARELVVLVLTALAAWLLTFRWERFLVGITALLAVLLAGGIARAWPRDALARILIVLAVAVGLLAGGRAAQSVASFSGGLPVALGRESPASLTERSLPVARLFRRMEETMDPSRHRVLFLGETRHHGLDLPHESPSVFNTHRLMTQLARNRDAAAATASLCADGFTHLLVDPGWMKRSASSYPSLALLRTDPGRVRGYLGSLGPPALAEGSIAVLELPGCSRTPTR